MTLPRFVLWRARDAGRGSETTAKMAEAQEARWAKAKAGKQ
jgi:hypothetical protein